MLQAARDDLALAGLNAATARHAADVLQVELDAAARADDMRAAALARAARVAQLKIDRGANKCLKAERIERQASYHASKSRARREAVERANAYWTDALDRLEAELEECERADRASGPARPQRSSTDIAPGRGSRKPELLRATTGILAKAADETVAPASESVTSMITSAIGAFWSSTMSAVNTVVSAVTHSLFYHSSPSADPVHMLNPVSPNTSASLHSPCSPGPSRARYASASAFGKRATPSSASRKRQYQTRRASRARLCRPTRRRRHRQRQRRHRPRRRRQSIASPRRSTASSTRSAS